MEKWARSMANSMTNYWAGKDVLVTGHTGFKGMWLSIYLKNMGAKVFGISDSGDDVEKILYRSVKNLEIFSGESFIDIRDGDRTKKIISEINPEIVFHLAAQPLVRLSYQTPIETFQTNIIGTANVLDGIRLAPSTRKVICVTSDKCYRNVEQVWGYRENDPLGGADPYSASKGAAEIVSYSMWHSFLKEKNVSMATVRTGNVIGGGDFSNDRIMTDIVKSRLNKQKLELRNPSATRPWQHVLEPIHAYTLIVEETLTSKPGSYSSFNIGPDNSNIKTVSDLVKQVTKFWNLNIFQNDPNKVALYEAHLLSLDNTKVKSETSWRPKWDFETTIEKTINWYDRFLQTDDALTLCVGDINNYFREKQS